MFVLFCACDVMNVLSVKKWKITKQFDKKKNKKKNTMFSKINSHRDDEGLAYKVEVLYMEIYNEKVHDLLDPKG